MTIQNVIKNSVQITGLNAGVLISERFPADWNITNFQSNGDVDSPMAISNQRIKMLTSVLVFEHDGNVYAYQPTAANLVNDNETNVEIILADERRRESARWISQADFGMIAQENLSAQIQPLGASNDNDAPDNEFTPGWYRTSLSIGAGSGALTLFNSFVPLAGRAANLGVAGAMVVPTAIITGMINYYLQIQKYKSQNGGQAPTGDALEAIKHSSKLLTYQMGAAVLGATAATIVFQRSGLATAIENSMGSWTGATIAGMPMEFQIGMMLASGIGLAIGLTAMCAYQVWSGKDTNDEHKKVSHFAAVFAIGLAVGMGAVLASTFLPHGLRQAGSPGVVAKLVGVLADFGVVAGLFATYGPAQKGFENGGEAVKSKLTFLRDPQPDDYHRMNDDADNGASNDDPSQKKGSRWNCLPGRRGVTV